MSASISSGLAVAALLSISFSSQSIASPDCNHSFTCALQAGMASPAAFDTPVREPGADRHIPQSLSSAWPPLTFEGLDHLEEIQSFYAGGLGSEGSGPGPDYGITFSDNALAVISQEAGGGGDFANNPSGDTTMSFITGTAATLNVPAGFEVGFSFFYSAAEFPGEVVVYDGLDGSGNVLATIHLPVTPTTGETPYLWDNWQPIGMEFTGVAHSVDFSGTIDQIGFDNITIGTNDPDSLFHDRFEQ